MRLGTLLIISSFAFSSIWILAFVDYWFAIPYNERSYLITLIAFSPFITTILTWIGTTLNNSMVKQWVALQLFGIFVMNVTLNLRGKKGGAWKSIVKKQDTLAEFMEIKIMSYKMNFTHIFLMLIISLQFLQTAYMQKHMGIPFKNFAQTGLILIIITMIYALFEFILYFYAWFKKWQQGVGDISYDWRNCFWSCWKGIKWKTWM